MIPSIHGIVTEMYRSLPSFMDSINVIQFELSTFCAGSCPVARYMAVKIFAACALNPPIEPAIADPTRFLDMFRSTIASTDVFKTDCTIALGIIASADTDFPLPSIQLMAAGFLSVQ